MGNSNGAMSKYTDLAQREPLYQGGFIWDFIDQAILKKTGTAGRITLTAEISATGRPTAISAPMVLSMPTGR